MDLLAFVFFFQMDLSNVKSFFLRKTKLCHPELWFGLEGKGLFVTCAVGFGISSSRFAMPPAASDIKCITLHGKSRHVSSTVAVMYEIYSTCWIGKWEHKLLIL